MLTYSDVITRDSCLSFPKRQLLPSEVYGNYLPPAAQLTRHLAGQGFRDKLDEQVARAKSGRFFITRATSTAFLPLTLECGLP